jgi:hypothetical protein
MAKDSSGHAASQERSAHSGGLGKKLPEVMEALLTKESVRERPVRIVFPDAADLAHGAEPDGQRQVAVLEDVNTPIDE